ncbi:MAG TPA: VWA domain-containing protein [Burkholderiales bacterium]|jgi:Ca-activated chloride channel family protein|nr:VWA domain-containing protein [Burkholderiales bacterium]
MHFMPQLRELTFIWPLMLWLLLLVPLLVLAYLRLAARQRLAARNLAKLAAVDGVSGREPSAFARHVSALLLLFAIILMIAAVARPQAVMVLPTRVDAIILAMDVSGSMRATDVKPNRLAAAQNAAKTFISDQPAEVKIGVVAIAATAALVQSPTTKRDDLIGAIDRFKLQNGSALGSGVIIALATMLPDSGIDIDQVVYGKKPLARDPARQAAIDNFKAVPAGSNTAAAIVLVSDGEGNTGPELAAAAKFAAERGVRIYTVGVGTRDGAVLSVDGWSMRVRLDEEGLKKVAATTRGEYFRAANANELKRIYSQLSARLTAGRGHTTEISALFAAAGAALAMISVLYSLLRFNRVF